MLVGVVDLWSRVGGVVRILGALRQATILAGSMGSDLTTIWWLEPPRSFADSVVSARGATRCSGQSRFKFRDICSASQSFVLDCCARITQRWPDTMRQRDD